MPVQGKRFTQRGAGGGGGRVRPVPFGTELLSIVAMIDSMMREVFLLTGVVHDGYLTGTLPSPAQQSGDQSRPPPSHCGCLPLLIYNHLPDRDPNPFKSGFIFKWPNPF